MRLGRERLTSSEGISCKSTRHRVLATSMKPNFTCTVSVTWIKALVDTRLTENAYYKSMCLA